MKRKFLLESIAWHEGASPALSSYLLYYLHIRQLLEIRQGIAIDMLMNTISNKNFKKTGLRPAIIKSRLHRKEIIFLLIA